ncbi:MAG: GNAT family N-acetyltransferase [Steroidobacteraceae bacterium]
MSVSIAMEPPSDPEVIRLIEELDAYQRALYPASSCQLLDLEALSADNIRFFVARANGEALGCGALRVQAYDGYGEVKRMFVQPRARGQRLGWRLLEAIEAQARREQCQFLRLETGINQPEALGLYRAAGFVECAPFDGYQPDPLSVFMEKPL